MPIKRFIVSTSVTLLIIAISGCAGIGSPYDRPAPSDPIPFVVQAIDVGSLQALRKPPPADTDLPLFSATERYTYRINPGDVLSIFIQQTRSRTPATGSVAGQTDAETQYLVNEEGQIFLPFHGALSVGGLSTSQAFELVRSALSRFINNPQVNLRVADFRSQRVAVIGSLEMPGFQTITDRPMTLPEAVLSAGPTQAANLREVVLKRDGTDHIIDVINLQSSATYGQDLVLQNGDVVLVPKNTNKVYILGEAPNLSVPIDPGHSSLAEVLLRDAAHGGSDRESMSYLQAGQAQPGSIFVIRGDTKSAQVFHLNGSSPESFLLADQFRMEDRDIVFISTRGITRFNRFIGQFLPTLQTLLGPLLIANQVDSLSE